LYLDFQKSKSMDLDLKGQHALVCGSSQGIGKAIAIELAELGAHITLFSRNDEKLNAVKNELSTSHNNQHSVLIADFTDPSEVKQKLNGHISSKNIAFDIVINNTGGPKGGPLQSADIKDFRVAFNQHVIASHVILEEVLPGMKAKSYGRIISITSTSVVQPIKGLGLSNTIRAAVTNWSKTLSEELAADGITLNCVMPGSTDTERLNYIFKDRSERSGNTVNEEREAMKSVSPTGRFATAEEIASAVAFLASPSASYITGVNLAVDGGKIKSV